MAEAYPALQERFILPHQPDGLSRALASKKEMHRLAVEHGVPTPQASFPSSIDDVYAFASDAVFPVMVKGIFSNRLDRRAGQTLFIVERPEELVRLYRDLEDPGDPNLMLQEYIPGGDDAVWMFNGYFDADSECLFGLTGRKLRQTPAYAGATSLGVCLPNATVDGLTRRWMKALGYSGMLDLGYRYDARDGQYKVLDVNPRIGSTFRLFVGRHGLDVARAHYLDLTGQPVPADEMIEGRRWLDEHDFASSLRYWRDGRLTVRQWATSLRGVQESVYVARDDPAPLARLGLKVASTSIRGKRSRKRNHSIDMPTHGARLLGGVVRLADALCLRSVLRRAVLALPQSLRVRLIQIQVRTGYVQGLILVPEAGLESSLRAALALLAPDLALPGSAYLEFGVFVGTSMACMYRAASAASATGLRLIGFDSFQGMPAGVAEQANGRWHKGDLYADVALTRANLRRLGVPEHRVELVEGWFEDTLNDETRSRLRVDRAAVVMVDCVSASATKLVLGFVAPLIRDRAIVYVDGWALADLADGGLGKREAFESWIASHPELAAEDLPALRYASDARALLITRTADAGSTTR